MVKKSQRKARTSSLLARRGILLFVTLATLGCLSIQGQTPRPKIIGVASVSAAASPPREAIEFYGKFLGFRFVGEMCASVCIVSVHVNLQQSIDVLVGHPTSTEKEDLSQSASFAVTFQTTDARALREFLISQGVQCGEFFQNVGINGSLSMFYTTDPEGHRVGFSESHGDVPKLGPPSPNQVSRHLIHAGFVVHDRTAEDKFYKDILGFRVYWHGGMKDNETDWVDMQVPDGTDWLEYMLSVPADADKRELGVMNHIALGVPDIKTAREQLLKNGMKLTEEPQIGRDGKWQLNLYDPNGTRVELMEFTPVQKPCCSEFTGPHPKP